MPRLSPTSINPRTMLAASCAILVLTAVLPGRLTPFAGWAGELIDLAVAPVQRPMSAGLRWLRGPQAGRPTDAQLLALQVEADSWKLRSRQAEQEVERLRNQIVQLQRGLALNPSLAVRQLTAPVIGFGSDASSSVLKVQAGERNGVIPGSVAVFDGVNLVGRVARPVDARVCRITPITDRSAGALSARIFPNEAPGSPAPATVDVLPGSGGAPDAGGLSLECKLTPDGRGLLVGPVEWQGVRPDQQNVTLAQGMVVRLSDSSWPQSAQMLVVGRIERVETTDVGRTRVSVRPMFDLQRLGEVTIRVSGEPDDAANEAPRGPGGGS